ncbi:MAG: hypothetical protein R2748_27835 [Bryobacterales bacterium]
MTPGDCGSREYSASDVSGMRRAEGQGGGADRRDLPPFLDRRDLRIFYDDPDCVGCC